VVPRATLSAVFFSCISGFSLVFWAYFSAVVGSGLGLSLGFWGGFVGGFFFFVFLGWVFLEAFTVVGFWVSAGFCCCLGVYWGLLLFWGS
jgi:hypothetical protein